MFQVVDTWNERRMTMIVVRRKGEDKSGQGRMSKVEMFINCGLRDRHIYQPVDQQRQTCQNITEYIASSRTNTDLCSLFKQTMRDD